jgi:hypothetical protein
VVRFSFGSCDRITNDSFNKRRRAIRSPQRIRTLDQSIRCPVLLTCSVSDDVDEETMSLSIFSFFLSKSVICSIFRSVVGLVGALTTASVLFLIREDLLSGGSGCCLSTTKVQCSTVRL